ncbi:hypothetical protein [uncultured Dysosmobacter sp.]|uniref:hypothetical protein n=1 Tax=uncultured Dysosmobacter sp. TaxID=2591384 RepID=UPI0026044C62|nr:hypothetical protein [uncultured Dysosmobacter sp.]
MDRSPICTKFHFIISGKTPGRKGDDSSELIQITHQTISLFDWGRLSGTGGEAASDESPYFSCAAQTRRRDAPQ